MQREQNDKLYKWWQNCQKELKLYIYEDKCPYLCVHVTSTAIEQQTMKTTICSARLSTRQLYARGSEKYKWPWGLKSVATCSDIHFINLVNDGTVSTTNKQNSKHLSQLQSWIRNFSLEFFILLKKTNIDKIYWVGKGGWWAMSMINDCYQWVVVILLNIRTETGQKLCDKCSL